MLNNIDQIGCSKENVYVTYVYLCEFMLVDYKNRGKSHHTKYVMVRGMTDQHSIRKEKTSQSTNEKKREKKNMV